ncbi:MAG: M1 family aminopeptidase [Bacteroidota bacterium]|nr:M1 family aminopeptidase [Bacteroidota bacterium]
MKKLFILLLIGAFHNVVAQSPDPDFNDKMAFSEGRLHHKSATFVESTGYAEYDLTYQRLNFTVDPAVNYISGSVISILKFQKDDVTQVRFDLVSEMFVDSVQYNHKKVVFQHLSNVITINLPIPAKKNTIGSTEVFYHGVPSATGMGSFTTSRHNNVPVIYTLSEPYGARDWWPCKQSLTDKIDSLDVYITCPSQFKAASNGKLVSDKVTGDKRTAYWQHRYPIATYLVAIAVTNYETYSDFLDLPNGKKIEVLNYIYPEYLSTAKSKSDEILSILQFYNTKFITYPFADEKYGHAQFGWGGGMEHQTMSFMTTLDYELVAHEMAHQWFGDYITLASWHDIWLNEGFATYLTGLVFENLQNGVWWPIWKNNELTRITSSPGGSVYVADTTDIPRMFNGRLSYSKGAYLLHMLRWEMGDELFFQGMKNYLNDKSVAFGFASQEKFVKHMETVADTSFTEFFNDWYYGEGYPIFQLTYFPDPVNPARQKLRVSQTPSHSSVPFFEMHIPIRIWKNGKATDIRIHLTRQNQEFAISDQPFDKLEFDPDQWLIAKSDQVLPALNVSQIKEIQIIPEFATNRIHVLLPFFSGKEVLRIFDLSGKTISAKLLQAEDSWVDILNLQKGLYLAEVQTKTQNKTVKFVVD